MTCERKISRKIYGAKCEKGMWRMRSNLELQYAHKSSGIVGEIKTKDWNGWGISSEWKIPVYRK
jgi:hypothetical protein